MGRREKGNGERECGDERKWATRRIRGDGKMMERRLVERCGNMPMFSAGDGNCNGKETELTCNKIFISMGETGNQTY